MIARGACHGCYDDFYNKPDSRCWSAKAGRMMTRFKLHYLQAPTEPRAFTEVRAPSCYRTPNAFVYYDKLPDFVKLADVVRPRAKAVGR